MGCACNNKEKQTLSTSNKKIEGFESVSEFLSTNWIFVIIFIVIIISLLYLFGLN